MSKFSSKNSRKRNFSVKLRKLSIQNYKGIDSLELDFPPPDMPDDPDILIMGSENGLGKTSVLECCSLLLFALSQSCRENPENLINFRYIYNRTDFPELLIRAGSSNANISGVLEYETNKFSISLTIDKVGGMETDVNSKDITPIRRSFRRSDFSISKSDYYDGGKEKKRDFFHKICGFTSDIMVDDLTLFFHSYRKVQEGNPRLGSLLEGRYSQHISKYREEPLVSVFKRVALFSIMSRANLFDGIANNDSEEVLNKLNELIKQYANGKITKLRPAPDDTIEFRIQPATGKESFNFDGLSSGQKEIISTLFLIWHETREHPRIVLIDEPELHLNSQWHRSFINYLIKMAPNNQYIIATHSEAIMESVEKNRRVLLQNSE